MIVRHHALRRSPAPPSAASLAAAAPLVTAALGALLCAVPARAADRVIRLGVDLSLTGADADSGNKVKDGVLLAIDEANSGHLIPGVTVEPVLLDDATATAGQYDPAQAATNARKMVSDRAVVAAIGPQMSGAAKAMAPILSMGGLAMITPEATNPDLTDPRFAGQYRPSGKVTFFRTVTTDAFQGPNMANFFADTLHAKRIYILDDGGAFGVGLGDRFAAQAKAKGIEVLGRDRLDPKAADYSPALTKIKALGADSLYYGGVSEAGVKVIKQSYDIIPDAMKGGGDGLLDGAVLTGAGFPAAQGWYVTIAAPHMLEDTKLAAWTKTFKDRYGVSAGDYSITGYDGTQVILAAIKGLVAANQDVTRESVRAAIAASSTDTLQGPVAFDANGDVNSKVVSVFQVRKDTAAPLDDVASQFKYVGVAPAH